jgi:hypothetical protein
MTTTICPHCKADGIPNRIGYQQCPRCKGWVQVIPPPPPNLISKAGCLFEGAKAYVFLCGGLAFVFACLYLGVSVFAGAMP